MLILRKIILKHFHSIEKEYIITLLDFSRSLRQDKKKTIK